MYPICSICNKQINLPDQVYNNYYNILVEENYRDYEGFLERIGQREYDELKAIGFLDKMITESSIFICVCYNCASSRKEASELAHNHFSLFKKL